MERITRKHVERMAGRLARAAAALELPSTVHVQAGSPTNGRAWRLFGGTGGDSLPYIGGDRGYIGWSAREAYDTLHAVAYALEAVAVADVEANR